MPHKNKEPDPKIQKGKKNEFEIMAKLWSTACLYVICRSRIQSYWWEPSHLSLYNELDAVLGTRAASSPPIVLESSGAGSSTDQYRSHRGVWYQEEVGRGRDGGEMEGAGAEAWRKDADDDKGFYTKNGGMPSYFLTAPVLQHHHLFLCHPIPSHHALIFHILVPPHPSLLITPL